ncbi:Cys-tRNA(Pro) deacylase [Catenuloplanes indicus]|uniref:Cys-tRNA(Pro)/Cys-tRNA(Cys) deacylase n=1 Tax=Catenuloplanes indicus TaxID=137267 RepID=A0AAE3W092_9ACTN|nr:Cys-tRNA(Pro) deacylase [Catenuloplanes indicus]MDQ0367101.1 Cys-tRNA(Pro)/Cys-tRNA(Cys) deacylase [Catenuloplanes indicus]
MAKSASKAGGTPATTLLTRQKIAFTAHTYEVDPKATSYGEAAASALGVAPTRLFKTLVATVDGQLAVGVVPVSASLDLKALAAALGGKRATMADPAAAERATGYVTGGISPFGQRSRLRIVVDSSAEGQETVFVSGGRRGLQVEVPPSAFPDAAGAIFAPIATG